MICKMSELAKIKRGTSPIPIVDYLVNDGLPWLKISDFKYGQRFVFETHEFIKYDGLKSTKLLKQGTLIITNSGSPGIPIFLGKDMCVHNGFLYFENISDKIIPMYLYYFLLTKRTYLSKQGNGSVFINLNIEILSKLKINLPPLSHQQHIVDTIGSVDDLIEKYEKKFIQLIKKVLFLFRKYESSNSLKVHKVFQFTTGKTFKSIEYAKHSKNKLITIKNINNYCLDLTDLNYIKDEYTDTKYLLKNDDILLTMTGSGDIGRIAIVDEGNCYLNQRVLKINCISPLYAFCYFLKYKNLICSLFKGTAQLNLSLSDLKNLSVRNSLKEILSFKKYDVFFELMLNIKWKIKKLKEIKRILLLKYF